LLKSGITTALYDEFVSTYQSYHHNQQTTEKPFVYVGDDGMVKYVTNVVDIEDDGEIFAVSVAEDGWMEFLAFSVN
jgi:hypothetical protein